MIDFDCRRRMIFAVLIVVHEAGHFAMAKRLGVRVIRFSVGYPPKLFGVRRGETEYSIRRDSIRRLRADAGREVGEEPTPEEMQNLPS